MSMSMSMLEIITKASTQQSEYNTQSEYPIVINPDPIFPTLKPKSKHSQSLITPLQGWSLSQTDSEIIQLTQNFNKKLKTKLKNTNSFTKEDFFSLLNPFLEKSMEQIGLSVSKDAKGSENGVFYTKLLIEKGGFLMGESVISLVIEACLVFEIWEVLECLIVGGLVNGSCSKVLVKSLVEKKRGELVCLCVKYVGGLEVFDVVAVFRFFLSGERVVGVKEEWERETVSVIEMCSDKSLGEKKMSLVKDVAVLLMMGYDEFTTREICLHYLVSSSNVDDVIFSACIGKLNGAEIMGFVRYLKKWLVKYQKFPQACVSSKGLSLNGVKAIESVPSLENVTKCFGLVIDEHFSSLVMHPEFCEEVKSIELAVNSLASEARLCCTLANLSANLKN